MGLRRRSPWHREWYQLWGTWLSCQVRCWAECCGETQGNTQERRAPLRVVIWHACFSAKCRSIRSFNIPPATHWHLTVARAQGWAIWTLLGWGGDFEPEVLSLSSKTNQSLKVQIPWVCPREDVEASIWLTHKETQNAWTTWGQTRQKLVRSLKERLNIDLVLFTSYLRRLSINSCKVFSTFTNIFYILLR